MEFLTADGVRATINIDQYEKLEIIAISRRLEVFAPQPLQHKLKIFVGGIGEPPNIE